MTEGHPAAPGGHSAATPTPAPPWTAPPAARNPRRRPWLFWPAVVLALAAVVGGVVVAAVAYAGTGGPDGAVRGYFAALRDADAPAALAFGDVPAGSRALLTSRVVREQRRIAPLTDVVVGPTTRSGSTARVHVRYRLGFPSAPQTYDATVRVHRSGSGWRLSSTAVPVRLSFTAASQRATLLGGTPPAGDVLLFPGAVPIRFDTAYLGLVPDQAAVTVGADPNLRVGVQATAAGRAAMRAATLAAVRACLTAAHPAVTCPLPAQRYVPGSVHGAIAGPLTTATVAATSTAVGTLEVDASLAVQATTYQRLDFYNHVSQGSGRLTLLVHAIAPAVAPLSISWLAP